MVTYNLHGLFAKPPLANGSDELFGLSILALFAKHTHNNIPIIDFHIFFSIVVEILFLKRFKF